MYRWLPLALAAVSVVLSAGAPLAGARQPALLPRDIATPTVPATGTATASPTDTSTATASPSVTPTATATPSSSATSTETATQTSPPTHTATPTRKAATPTRSATPTRKAATPTRSATPTASPTITPTQTLTPTETATPSPTLTLTPLPTASATPKPVRTPSPHPGFGVVPWKSGEFYSWTLSGEAINGTAWQLITQFGHQWIDQSAFVERVGGTTTSFASRLAFDVNTYALRRYDGIEDEPPSVLHTTLFGGHLDYTSYQSWEPIGCTAGKDLHVLARTVAYGMMSDLVRSTELRDSQHAVYPVFDPYGKALAGRGTYRVVGRQTMRTILGRVATVRVRFQEGAELPIDIWYTADRAHIVVQWAEAGQFTAVLAHYEPQSARVALPFVVATPRLVGRAARCA